jgi:hypothetical protein
MASFSFWYDESCTYKAWFTADSLEHAEELLRKVQEGEIILEDLPEFFEKHKSGDVQVALDTLEVAE